MAVVLGHDSYGKSRVRLTRVTRDGERHDLMELNIDIELEGDFAASYLEGDNSRVIATDSMKNTVYVLAKELGAQGIEAFGQSLARHFLQGYPQVTKATVALREEPWARMKVHGREHPHAFVGAGPERRTSTITATRQEVRTEGGFAGMLLLKTTDSSFAGFVRDRYTTLPETSDRIFATELTATWIYRTTPANWDDVYRQCRETFLEVFAGHNSLAVQQTLYVMGEAALEKCDAIEEVRLVMPNKHRILVNLSPFGLDNKNEVFVATDEPHGLITGTVRRGK